MRSVKPPAGYRQGVGIMLLDAAGHVFIGRRIGMAEAWQMPQGGIDPGEDPLPAAKRELKEETGIAKATLIAESAHWLSYDFPLPLRQEIWGGRFKGQTQKWFLMRFTGTDDDVDLDAHEAEFHKWRWAKPEELPPLAVEFKQALYRELLTEFGDKLAPG